MSYKQKQVRKKRHIGYSLMFSSASVIGITLTTGLVFFVMWYFSSDNLIMLKDMSVLKIFILTLMLGIVITFALRRLFISPLIKLVDAMNKVAGGDFSIRLNSECKRSDLTEVYTSFNTMVNELSNTDTLQSDFISNVSHEFKTPINALEGYASLLQDNSLSPEERSNYVEKILFNTRRLSELVGNVLLLSKVSSQNIQPKLTSYRLDEQIRQALLALESRWVEKDIDFDIELDIIEYTGMENLMGHVWTNLIDNAVKFSSKGGTVEIRLREFEDNVYFTIRNFGTIIPEESINNIFTKFYQCDTSRKSEGNGLGLPLAKRIVEESGGSIEAESSKESGSLFKVKLPL